MAFDDKKWDIAATQGEVAGIAVSAELAIRAITLSLLKIQEKISVDIEPEIEEITKASTSLREIFEDFTGWSDAN